MGYAVLIALCSLLLYIQYRSFKSYARKPKLRLKEEGDSLEHVERIVREVFEDIIGVELSTDNIDTPLSDLFLDSKDLLSIYIAIEDELDIELTDEEWEECISAHEIIELVSTRI